MEENGKTGSPLAESGTETAGPEPAVPAVSPARAAETKSAAAPSSGRPDMAGPREPLYRQEGGYRLRLEPADLARLRELPGSKGKSDTELGEQFFDGQAARLTGAVSEDVPPPAEVRVVVDPYSRQAFLAVGKTIRGIVSF
jgi:hypothetical protein